MNIYTRTFSALKPYWKQLVTASTSSAFHAVFAGLVIWLIGPLLMTLFQIETVPGGGGIGTEVIETPGAESGNVVTDLGSWIYSLKASVKGMIDSLVVGIDRRDTLINFCLLLLTVSLAKGFFYYVQAFFMVWVQQSVMRDFRDRLFEKYQRLSLGSGTLRVPP